MTCPGSAASLMVAWTGHRPDLFADPAAARQAVQAAASQVVRQRRGSPLHFLVGGQRGVDTWAAQAATDLAVTYSVVLPLPPEAFGAEWSVADRAMLDHILACASDVRIVGRDEAVSVEHAYTERNCRLAAAADLLVAVWTGQAGGGTAQTIAFARQFGRPVREVRLAASPTAGSASGRGV